MKEEIQTRNLLMIILLWIFMFITFINNTLFSDIKVTSVILLIYLPPLLLVTILVIKKLFINRMMYLITLLSLFILFLLNYAMDNYINLLFFAIPPVLSIMYRNWKNMLLAIVGGGILFYYFTYRNGALYFVDWQPSDIFFFLGFILVASALIISEAKMTENVRKKLSKELKEGNELKKKLAESESKYRSMVIQSTEGIYAFDPETAKIVEASQQFCKMLGYSEDEVKKLKITDIIAHDDSSVNENIMIVLTKNKHFLGERKYKHKDGEILDVEVRATLIKTDNQNYILANICDITEMKKKSQELILSKKVLDHSLDGVLVTDINQKIIHVNSAFERITGFLSNEVIGKTPRLLKSNVHHNEFYQNLWKVIKNKGFWEGDIHNLKKNGDLFIQHTQIVEIVDEKQVPVFYASIFRDITHEVELKQQLEDSEQRYKSLFENNQGASFMIDIDGHFTKLNNIAEKISGYSITDLIGTFFLTIIHKQDHKKVIQSFEKVLKGQSDTINVRLIHPNGDIVFLNIISAPQTKNGKVIGVIGIAQDITKQKMVEQQLKLSEERYRSLLKLSPEVIFVHSATKIEFINDKALSFIGANHREELLGKTIFEFLHEDDRQIAVYNFTLGFSDPNRMPEFKELRFVRLDGKVITADVGATMIDYNGERAVLGIIHDITEKIEIQQKFKEANELLTKLARLDGLTGVPNRRYYDETLEKERERMIRNNQPLSLLMIDIDHFKAFNDTYGHQDGDHCLKVVANAIKTSLNRATDFMARYGGEEFSVILPDTNEEGALFVAEKIRSRIEALKIPNIHSGVKPTLTISIGVAITSFKDSLISCEQLIDHSDKALYKSKQNGRNQVNLYKKQGDASPAS